MCEGEGEGTVVMNIKIHDVMYRKRGYETPGVFDIDTAPLEGKGQFSIPSCRLVCINMGIKLIWLGCIHMTSNRVL